MSPDPMSRTCQITDGRQESFSLGYLVGKLWKHLRSVMLGLSMSNTKEVYVEVSVQVLKLTSAIRF